MSGGYSALAGVYDRLNGNVDYSEWADFIEECYARFAKEKPSLVLELGCGTGSMTLEMDSRGYDMTALDISPEMLSEAYTRAFSAGRHGILFLEGDMCDFELYGTVGSVICCLDGINHITDREDLARCFSLVHNYLDPDGLFIFDVNTPHKFRTVYADNDYVLEENGALCVWQNRLSDDGEQCDFHLSVFEKCSDGRYTRRDGVQTERCYDEDTLRDMLSAAGFQICGIFGGFDFSEICGTSERWHIIARAEKRK